MFYFSNVNQIISIFRQGTVFSWRYALVFGTGVAVGSGLLFVTLSRFTVVFSHCHIVKCKFEQGWLGWQWLIAFETHVSPAPHLPLHWSVKGEVRGRVGLAGNEGVGLVGPLSFGWQFPYFLFFLHLRLRQHRPGLHWSPLPQPSFW